MEYYELGVKPSYYIIFEQENFKERPKMFRKGTRTESIAIKTTLDGLGFEGPDVVRDASQNDIFKKLKDVFNSKSDDYGSVIVVILTHGGEGYTLWAHDTPYQFIKLFEDTMQSASDSLKDKPKVFIIQACNGHMRDHSTLSVAAGTSNLKYSPDPFLLPAFPHVLMAFSSSPGYHSFRKWFIQCLCQSINEYSSKHDFETLLTIARRAVGEKRTEKEGQPCVQIPIVISTLTKKLRLPPSPTASSTPHL